MNRRLQWKLLDNYRRKLFLKNEAKKHLLNSLIRNENLPDVYRSFACFSRAKLSTLSSVTKVNDRCVRTGRNRAINKLTKFSRFFFRTESYKGNLPGFSRASW